MTGDKEANGTEASGQPTPEEIAEALNPGNDNDPALELEDVLSGMEGVLGEGESDPFDVLQKFQSENEDLKDQLLRSAAEMQNLRRRAERERQEASQYAAASFARDIISVADNLSRALEAIPVEARETLDEATRNLITGVEMTERELISVFGRHGITKLEPMGEKFDPNLHEAMFEAPDPSLPSGTVMAVTQCGYKIGGRVLRPAMVGVSKDGPKSAADTELPPDGDDPAA
ncbi:MAG: nucleotide exchange factor GrpE [Pseudomonadota bacterium]